MSLGLTSLSLSLRSYGGGGSAPVPGMSLATIPAPSGATVFRWNPAFSTVTEVGGRAELVTDLEGNANLTKPVATTWNAPKVLTDGRGRRFLRFEGQEYLDIAAGLSTVSSRACGWFMVGRIHKGKSSSPLMSLGSWEQGTQVNGGNTLFRTVAVTNSPATLGVGSLNSNAVNNNREHMAMGSQLAVMGMITRTTANGGAQYYVNDIVGSYTVATQVGSGITSTTGGEIGRAPGTVAGAAEPSVASAGGGFFDAYDIYFVDGNVTDAEANAIMAGFQAEWQIAETTNYAVIEGDSIFGGISPLTSAENLAMVLTEPGSATALPASWRVVLSAVSGSVVSSCVTRRDSSVGPLAYALSGRNVVSIMIGRNDAAAGGGSRTGAFIYSGADAGANYVDLIGDAGTGYKDRGFETVVTPPIANSGNPAWIGDLRALLEDLTQFRTDTGAADAQELRIASSRSILDGSSNTVFDTAADALDTTYYDDAVHTTATGTAALATGLSTPQYGLAARILATTD